MIKWAVGVTTAPREPSTLYKTQWSIRAAGWDRFAVFADGEARIGPYLNFLAALQGLVSSKPSADAFVVFQDDISVSEDLRSWLEGDWQFQCLLEHDPTCPTGVISLYTAAPNHVEEPGWRELEFPATKLGALAYVFPSESARAFLAFPPSRTAARGTDVQVARWCRDTRREYWCHSPSFVMHTGHQSALENPGGVPECRQCKAFATRAGSPSDVLLL